MKLLAFYLSLGCLMPTVVVSSASILHPFRRHSIDQERIDEHSRILNDMGQRLSSLELTVSQLQVQLSVDRRPSMSSIQRRPEVRRSSRSENSVPSLRRLPSDYSGQSHLSPPAE